MGFPQSVLYETRSIAFSQMTDRVELFQYQRAAGNHGRTSASHQGGGQRWPWIPGVRVPVDTDGDYTFVVDTVGMDEQGLDGSQRPPPW